MRPSWGALGLLVLLATACPAPIPPPSDALFDAEPLLARAQAAWQQRRSLSGEARVEFYGPQGAVKGKLVLAARRPAAVYLQALSPAGEPLAVLATDGIELTHYERGSQSCFVGLACSANVGRLIPLHLSPRSVVTLLNGGVPLIPAGRFSVDWDTRHGAYHLTRFDDATRRVQELWLRAQDFLPLRATLDEDRKRIYDVEFGQFERLDQAVVAKRLDIRLPPWDVDLRLLLRDIEVNRDLADSVFEFHCPQGTQRYWLDCAGGPATPEAPAEDLP